MIKKSDYLQHDSKKIQEMENLSNKLKGISSDIFSEIKLLIQKSRELTTDNPDEQAIVESIFVAEKAFGLAQKSGDKDLIHKASYNLARLYKSNKNYNNALRYFMESQASLPESKGKSEGDLLMQIALMNENMKDYTSALEFYRKAFAHKKEAVDAKGMAISLNNIANVYRHLGNYHKALECLFESINIKNEIGDKKGISKTLNNIGGLYCLLNDFDMALQYYFESIKLKEKIEDYTGIGDSLYNIGLVHKMKGNSILEKDYVSQALTNYQKVKNIKGIAQCSTNLGEVCNEIGSFTESIHHLQNSLKIYEKLGRTGKIASSLYILGNVYYDQKIFDEALNTFLTCKDLAVESGCRKIQSLAFKRISECYEIQGDYKTAFTFYKQYQKLSETIIIESKNHEISKIRNKLTAELNEIGLIKK